MIESGQVFLFLCNNFECCGIFLGCIIIRGKNVVPNETPSVENHCIKLLKFGSPALWCYLLVRGANCLLLFFPPLRVFPFHVTSVSHGKLPLSPCLNIKLWVKSQPPPLLLPARGSLLTPPPWKPHAPLPLFHICSDAEKMPSGRRQHIEAPHVIRTG